MFVLLGTVVDASTGGVDEFGHLIGEFAIERVFDGRPLPARLPIVIGVGDELDCSVALANGEALVMLARLDRERRLHPSTCLPLARIDTSEGLEMLREIEAAYATSPPDEPAPAAPTASDFDAPLLVVAAGLGVVVLGIFGVLVAWSRRHARPPAA